MGEHKDGFGAKTLHSVVSAGDWRPQACLPPLFPMHIIHGQAQGPMELHERAQGRIRSEDSAQCCIG
jgi:hypothetical protein